MLVRLPSRNDTMAFVDGAVGLNVTVLVVVFATAVPSATMWISPRMEAALANCARERASNALPNARVFFMS